MYEPARMLGSFGSVASTTARQVRLSFTFSLFYVAYIPNSWHVTQTLKRHLRIASDQGNAVVVNLLLDARADSSAASLF